MNRTSVGQDFSKFISFCSEFWNLEIYYSLMRNKDDIYLNKDAGYLRREKKIFPNRYVTFDDIEIICSLMSCMLCFSFMTCSFNVVFTYCI